MKFMSINPVFPIRIYLARLSLSYIRPKLVSLDKGLTLQTLTLLPVSLLIISAMKRFFFWPVTTVTLSDTEFKRSNEHSNTGPICKSLSTTIASMCSSTVTLVRVHGA